MKNSLVLTIAILLSVVGPNGTVAYGETQDPPGRQMRLLKACADGGLDQPRQTLHQFAFYSVHPRLGTRSSRSDVPPLTPIPRSALCSWL
jgi:hypothetical protein